jgi:putative MATE family efflux protein
MSVISDDIRPNEMRKNILRLSWPAILRLFLQSLVGTVDVIMVGQLGSSAISAVGVSNRLVFIILGAFTALSIGSTALVAHHVGAREEEKGNEILWQSLIMSIILAAIFMVIGLFFSRDLLRGMLILMEEPDQFIINQGSIYIKIVLASMLFGFPLMIINAVFQGVGDMKTPLLLMIITNLTNVLFNWLLIFGIWIFPEMGVAGAGLGSALGRFVGCIIGVIILMKGKSHLKLAFRYLKLKLDPVILKSIFKIGIPSSFEQFSRQSSQILVTILVAGLGAGTAALAANEIAMNINNLTIMPGFGFSVAAVTLVGQSLGAEREDLAEQYGKQVTRLGVLLIIPVSIMMFLLARPLVMLFNDDKEVIPMALIAVRIIIVTQPLLAMVMIIAGALRGAGDTKLVMFITFIGNWGFRVALGYLLGYYFNIGLIGFWIAIGVDIAVRALLMKLRFNSGKWKSIQVLSRKEKIKKVLE